MSLEQQLADLTTAVNNLTAVLSSKMMAGTASGCASSCDKPAEAPKNIDDLKKEKPSPKPEPAAASAAPPADIPATPAPTAAVSGAEIDFASQIQKPIVAMAAAGKRAQAMEILKACGASRASEIKPEDYAKAVELIKAAS